MAYHFIDNVHSKTLTPKDPNVELWNTACEQNIIVCLSNSSGKTFTASKLIQHVVNNTDINEGTITLYVADSPGLVARQAGYFRRMTDMVVGEYYKEDAIGISRKFKKSKQDQILLAETEVSLDWFRKKLLVMSDISLLILHGCQHVLQSGQVPMKELMKFYYESEIKPRVLGLSSSLFSSNLEMSQMEPCLTKMEKILDCKTETASNVVSLLRYGTRPHEVVIEYGPHQPSSIDRVIENEIKNALNFLKDHRYDPSEIYEGFFEELQNIPDPKFEPEEIFMQLLDVLHTLGPWSADRAALVLLFQIEKLKVTTPYERHFLLLCMTSSVLVKIRAILDDFFKDIDEKDRIYKFSSPKVLKLIDVLRKFRPEKPEINEDDCSEEEEEEEEEDEEEEEEDESELELSKLFSDLNSKRKLFDCDCELITTYLLERLRHSKLNVVSYGDFLNFLESKKEEGKKELLLVNTDCNQSVNESDKNLIERKEDKNILINDNTSVVKYSEMRTFKNGYHKKNGYLPVCNGKIVNISMGRNSSREGKINEVKTLENYLQYHEYLLLPKFKVDRQTRFDRFNVSSQFRGHEDFVFRQMKAFSESENHLCGLIFTEKKFTAKVLFHVLNDLKQADDDFSFLCVQFTVGKVVDGAKDPKGAETEHRKQELVLKKFRMRVCNLLIGTSFLEEGIDLPKCNLVIRFDLPNDYRSYINTKERARAVDPLYCLLVDSTHSRSFVKELSKYHQTEAMLSTKSRNKEPPEDEEMEADQYTELIKPFCPLLRKDCPHVDLSTAIALVNRYCAKLPSDTFTRLTPICVSKRIRHLEEDMFVCNIELPINSPVKRKIEGCPMPTRALARRIAAFQCCQILHWSGELDDTLQPISKESFWLREEQVTSDFNELEEMTPKDIVEPRPGSTKRRQYYYKKIADSLTDCLPLAGNPSFLYDISMNLTCPLPEEQNTRGRKIHPPEESSQGFGILTRKKIPRIGAFPIFTRSGEVQVKLELAPTPVVLSESQIEKIVAFIHYTFTSVLRLQKYLMMFDPNASENSYFIVPTKKGQDPSSVEVDWEFLELINEKRYQVPILIQEEKRKNFEFDASKFEDAVVSPWYRNQDQPQYLYVAEICNNLNPKSAFPGTEYDTFEEYYLKKYGIQIQNCSQALLDVDHTSARLNFLTPRYVNRKGVALPTTSEEKKKAKRENLKQKQILIPELCDIHPFPATLWRKAVCLPCILHRINSLLLADQVRKMVAEEIGVGKVDLDENFNWEPLNFGWSLADVLEKTKFLDKSTDPEYYEKKERKRSKENQNQTEYFLAIKNEEEKKEEKEEGSRDEDEQGEEIGDEKKESWIEIGTWSNDMAKKEMESGDCESELNSLAVINKSDRDLDGWDSEIDGNYRNPTRYCSPTSWVGVDKFDEDSLSEYTSGSSYTDDSMENMSESDNDSNCGGLKIEFTEDNVAEAVEKNQRVSNFMKEFSEEEEEEPWFYNESEEFSKYLTDFDDNVKKRTEEILKSEIFYEKDRHFDYIRPIKSSKNSINSSLEPLENSDEGKTFGSSNNVFPEIVEEIPEKLKSLPLTDVIINCLQHQKEKSTNNRIIMNEIESSITDVEPFPLDEDDICKKFSFDTQPELEGHPGPSPSLILQALTMSNANDGINLERLETIGDSFLKYAITTFMYCFYENVHEGKLSHLRSKQVSNFNLYRLGRRKMLGESMIATKFEPHDNWLPPCYYVPRELERALIEAGVPANHWNRADIPSLKNLSKEEICRLVKEKGEQLGLVSSDMGESSPPISSLNPENIPCFIPYNLMTQHSIPDKSIADCVEALIGAYLVACGPRGALLFMSWLGIRVLPKEEKLYKSKNEAKKGVGYTTPVKVMTPEGEMWSQTHFGVLQPPRPPLLRHVPLPEAELQKILRGFEAFEESIQYRFRDRSYLLQALTHASYYSNRVTDCYQRLEFLGDAVLDYLITRHLYEDSKHHNPGALTDLRSALVNNTIFSSLAVRHNFHKYFQHLCPSLNDVINRFVKTQEENGFCINEGCYLVEEEECEAVEDVEVPKALGDVFESVAGAIFLDSGMSLDAVWRVYYRFMKNEIEEFSRKVPKSPIRELFELEPETAQFGRPEKLADGKRVRVTVEVFGKGSFSGIGRNYRIAKCTAAKCALKQLKQKGLIDKTK